MISFRKDDHRPFSTATGHQPEGTRPRLRKLWVPCQDGRGDKERQPRQLRQASSSPPRTPLLWLDVARVFTRGGAFERVGGDRMDEENPCCATVAVLFTAVKRKASEIGVTERGRLLSRISLCPLLPVASLFIHHEILCTLFPSFFTSI